MHNRMKADLYAAGITSLAMVHHLIDHATAKAHTPRITPSRRYRRWKVIAARLAIAAVTLYAAEQKAAAEAAEAAYIAQATLRGASEAAFIFLDAHHPQELITRALGAALEREA